MESLVLLSFHNTFLIGVGPSNLHLTFVQRPASMLPRPELQTFLNDRGDTHEKRGAFQGTA